MNDAGASAHNLARQSANLSQHLGLVNGQPGLTGMDAATDVAKYLAWVTEQLGFQAQLLAEFVRSENEAGRIVPHPGVTKEVDVATSTGLVAVGVNSATAAADAAARAFSGIHALLADLATRDNLPQRIGTDPAMRSKGYALNILHAAVMGNGELLRELAGRTSDEDAAMLVEAMENAARALGLARDDGSASSAERASE